MEMPPPQKPTLEQAEEQVHISPVTITSPVTNNHTSHVAHDSMVTVRLSEPPSLHVDTTTPSKQISDGRINKTAEDTADTPNILADDVEDVLEQEEESPRITTMDPNGNEVLSPSGSESAGSQNGESRRGSDSSEEFVEGGGVNWEELQQTEENEPRSESSEDSTALLLARLEQENNLLVSNPKSGIAKVQIVENMRPRGQSRPPSMQHLKRLVNGPTPPSLRYSMIPTPPMTDLEFYAALVQDYTRTAQCLPTLLSKKIRSGIPPPLRGVVWQSMSGARDTLLEEQFDRLCGESSPYEGIIGKDLGRSFPGVEMFRDPEGDGQKMLGRVLKCFSLYDHKIGYCQGLGFLVGPLLMHMGDKQAFCVLVRLMEHYDLRSCFLPDLSGLHVRIYQFKKLMQLHLPELSAYLDHHQIEPAYVSQWFLSFFAVTCPLPMLFRIYDVIFAEGASETIMRVALSLMRKNQEKIMACTEFEDVMQLLLSRGLWDVYHYNADEFVNEFVSMTGAVTRESLQALELSYKEAQAADTVPPTDIGSIASRFLGRLWTSANSSTKSMSLSPGLTAPSRPSSFLRRSPSKQSIASTLNSMEGGVSDSMMSSSTDATSISRDSSNTDGFSLRGQSVNFNNPVSKPNKDKNLHGQIEDLLMALSELQRDHAILATQLQKEREEREEDRNAVRSLLDGLRKKTSSETVGSGYSDESLDTLKPSTCEEDEDEDETIVAENTASDSESEDITPAVTDLSSLLDIVEDRFTAPADNRRSSMLQTKSQLREDIVRAKEQLIHEISKTQDLNRQVSEQSQEIQNLKDQVKEGHLAIRNAHTDKQRLERQIHELKSRKPPVTTPNGSREQESEWPNRSSSSTGHSGLRELKLGRSASNKSQKTPFAYNKRSSSLATSNKENDAPFFPGATPPSEFPMLNPVTESVPSPAISKNQDDPDALVLELVQAKTAEAIAKQEAEEAKSKLESLRKLLGVAGDSSSGHSSGTAAVLGHRASPSLVSVTSGLGGYIGRPQPQHQASANVVPTASTNAGVGGFWGGWGKRAVSTEKVPGSGGL
ncbi:related to Rab6 GTPase activating protein, GAPCenA [Rhynchosporium agropyri]|uniref:Related to Rab6 GTPase activating protein, GAPCenA n=1 Tax=Rhynchosporium agropyri TaxID=914238 RepID=A0A1E1LHG8_9HELO|nr:related to Rab6 GTPase activating protein, GAPCenA [Rhynchosporium agropyri]